MKKILVLLFIFVLMPSQRPCEAQSQYCDKLSRIEKSLFDMVYDNQNDDVRLIRIEKNIYGLPSSGSIEKRVNKISKDLSADVIGQEIKPKKDSFLRDDEVISEKPSEDMDFSVVNNLEKKVFQYEFKKIDIGNRLSALENQVFKKCYLQDDLSTRIKRLQCVILYNKEPLEENKVKPIPYFKKETLIVEDAKEETDLVSHSFTKEEKMDSNSKIKLVSLEKAIFNKAYPNEQGSERLARLEAKIFQSTFPENNNETRLNRIESAKEAQNSIKKYKNNKVSKHIATAIETGVIILLFLPFLL